MTRGDVDALGQFVLGEVARQQPRRPGLLDRVSAVCLFVHAQHASQVRVGRHQRQRRRGAALGGAELGERLPVEGDQVLAAGGSARAASRSKPAFAAHVCQPGEKRVAALRPDVAALLAAAASRAGVRGAVAAGGLDAQTQVALAPRRSRPCTISRRCRPSPPDPSGAAQVTTHAPARQRRLLHALALGAPGGVERARRAGRGPRHRGHRATAPPCAGGPSPAGRSPYPHCATRSRPRYSLSAATSGAKRRRSPSITSSSGSGGAA